jgi:hypothetical protein
VAWRRDEPEPRQQLERAVDGYVLHAGRLDPLADRVVILAARVVELPALNIDRPAGEEVVAAAVVEVQVRVDDDVDAGPVEVGLRAQWNQARELFMPATVPAEVCYMLETRAGGTSGSGVFVDLSPD